MRPLGLCACCAALAGLTACSGGFGLDNLDSTPAALDSPDSRDWDPGNKDSDEPPDTGPTNPVPTITALTIEEVDDRVRFTFTVDDQDGDMRGGGATVEVGGVATVSYSIPDQVVSSGANTYYVAWKQDLFSPEQTYNCAVWVHDQSGNTSNTLSDTYARSAWSASVTEKGDEFGDVSGVGLVQTPAVIAGDIYKAGNDGADYTADIDFVKFRVEQSRSYRLTLTWEQSSADYDLYLMESGVSVLASSATYSTPERVTYSLQAATDYYLAVAGWSGPAGAWTVRIE